MVRRAAKVDGNQSEIVEALRGIPGLTVAITSAVGNGFPDIVVGYRGFNFLFEIKQRPEQQLNAVQQGFHDNWHGQVQKVSSLKEIITAMTGWGE